MNQEVFAAVAEALEKGEPAALVTIVSTTGSTPAAGRREDARLSGRPDGRHHRRRLLRERCVLEGSRGDHEPQAAAPALRAGRRLRAGNGADLRRADERVHRADRTVAGAVRHRRRPCRISPGHDGAGRRLPGSRRRRPREVREPRALSERRRGGDRRYSRVARAQRSCRRTPTS